MSWIAQSRGTPRGIGQMPYTVARQPLTSQQETVLRATDRTIPNPANLGQFNPAPSIAMNNGFNWAQLVGVAPVPAQSTSPMAQANGFQPNAFQSTVPRTVNIDLDMGGNTDQMVRAFLGPSLGWVNTYVMHTRIITTSGMSVVNPGEAFLIIDTSGDVTIMLPSVVMWLNQPFYRPATAFDRAIRFKVISAASVTLQPRGADLIDNVSGPITLDTGVDTLYPSSLGWIRG